MSKLKKLNVKQMKAVSLVALGRSGREVAEACGVTPETVSRWRQETLFNDAVNRILKGSQNEAELRLRSLMGLAVDTLEGILKSEETPPHLRYQVAKTVLELGNFKLDKKDEKDDILTLEDYVGAEEDALAMLDKRAEAERANYERLKRQNSEVAESQALLVENHD